MSANGMCLRTELFSPRATAGRASVAAEAAKKSRRLILSSLFGPEMSRPRKTGLRCRPRLAPSFRRHKIYRTPGVDVADGFQTRSLLAAEVIPVCLGPTSPITLTAGKNAILL